MLDARFFGCWHWIVPATTPRMASRQSFQSEPASVANAVRPYSFQKVRRTRRRKPAAGVRTGKQTEERRKRALINANEKTKQSQHQSRIEARFARRNHSCSSA